MSLITMDAPSPRVAARPAAPAGAPSRNAKGVVTAVFVSILFLANLGLTVGGFPLKFSLVAIYVLAAYGLWTRNFIISLPSVAFYGVLAAAAWVSTAINPEASAGSLSLLLVLYAPFVLRLHPRINARQWMEFCLRRYGDLAMILAFAGMLQFMLQFAIHAPWLFDIKQLFPEFLRAGGNYNTVIAAGGVMKSNGFFLREPSSFSALIAIALLIELVYFKRLQRLGVFAMAMALSYSGTGILILLLGLIAPTGVKAMGRAFVVLGAAFVFFLLFADALNLWFFLGRLNEFSTVGTSGYARFVAPVNLLKTGFYYPEWAKLLGHGPGTIDRAIVFANVKFEIFDPTWAKLIYEYGLVGSGAILLFLFATFAGRALSPSIRLALLYAWLASGGLLLQSDFCALLLLIVVLCPSVAAFKAASPKPAPAVPRWSQRGVS